MARSGELVTNIAGELVTNIAGELVTNEEIFGAYLGGADEGTYLSLLIMLGYKPDLILARNQTLEERDAIRFPSLAQERTDDEGT